MSKVDERKTEDEARSGGPSVRLLLMVLGSAVFVSVANSSMVSVALPIIQRDFGASEGQVSWIVTGYLLVFAIGIPLYGRLSDFYGLRRIFCAGLAMLALGSLFCALAPGLLTLIGGRAVQAAGAAAIPALSSSTVARTLPPGKRGGALGLITASAGVGAAGGPVAGGFVTQYAGWQVLFYGTIVLALLLITLAWFTLPATSEESGGRQAERHLDLPGGILLGLAAALLLFGVTQGENAGFGSSTAWGSFLGGVLGVAGFAWHIQRSSHPFVAPALLENRYFAIPSVVIFFAAATNIANIVVVPLMLIQVNGISAGGVGLVLVPGAVALAVLAPIGGRLSDRVGVRVPVITGLSLMLLSTLFTASFAVGASPWLVAVGVLGVRSGFAWVNAPITNALSSNLQGQEIGVGIGIFRMFFFLGGGVGPALAGAFLAARKGSATNALDPLYSLGAPAFSDTFLFMGPAIIVALLFSLWLGMAPAKPDR